MNDIVNEKYLDGIALVIKFIFSWLILLPIAVIISGKMLMKPIQFGTDSQQVLKIPLKIFVVEANGGEVILGFTGLLITLFFVAVLGGQSVYVLVKTNFGVDPGHFHSICFFSALMTVIWSAIIFLFHFIMTKYDNSSFVDDRAKYDNIISRLDGQGGE